MQAIYTTVGPLASSSATQIAASQTVPAAAGIAFTGVAGTYVANNVAASQSISGAAAVTLVSAIASGAALPGVSLPAGLYASQLYITSAGNDTGITFAVVGKDFLGRPLRETITGSNTSVVGSTLRYATVSSITTSGSTASTITIGTFLPVSLDTPREVIFTSGGVDTGITFTIKGWDAKGNALSETVTGSSGGVATSVLSYAAIDKITSSGATASTLTVGTNGVASSEWINLDSWKMGPLSGQCVVSGTVNYTIQVSNDDPNNVGNPIAPSAMTWDSTPVGIIGATGSASFSLAQAPLWIRVLLNSGSGSVRMTIAPHVNATH